MKAKVWVSSVQHIKKNIEKTEKLHREMWKKNSLETETIISLALYVVVVNVGTVL